ncbi:phosphonate transport system ATP-binding protein [Roseibium hamelinense]|uniref:Phosphonate transport system ATP-binding protein n=1 Tax=Roseibium hamelinense TaxID=150831 RepID=A0A562TI64_9HYPH|nr:phosphonate ABC transporter ATP-binding protein [Roseibium hamelinense]MTI43087.1 phosphonate ABC transporter ATP-binding protein [Roseibium hamelinense]TWI92566.1 phosphonate transport system ATP-binding protein [Roseibium hamelinense]
MIQFQDVTKTFGVRTAVDKVTFSIDHPQMIGVIGRSGAGKSTLLRMINRLTPATSGQILFKGENILSLKGATMRRWQRDCAMVFQQFNLVPRLDVVTNVMLGRLNGHGTLKSLFNIFSKDDVNSALAALDRLGIAQEATKRAEELSGGQQQRVAIARALMQDPHMVLADEPIASLDPMNAKIVMDALREIHERDNKIVLCNLHTLDTARAYCDRVIGMRDGKIVFDGAPDALSTDVAREIYGADESFNEAATSTAIDNGQSSTQNSAGAMTPAAAAAG